VNLTVALVGLLVGTFFGISGVGGSSLMTPLLILLLRIHPRSQPHGGSKARHLVAGGGHSRSTRGAVAAYGRRHFSLAALDSIVRHAVGVALIVSAVVLVVGIFARRAPRQAPLRQAQADKEPVEAVPVADIDWNRATHVKVSALGFFAGSAVSITLSGSGAITLPVLYAVLPRLGLRRSVGSDIAFATFLLPVAAVGSRLV
jgi:uncharacterized membrane protein YfcA